MPRGVRQGIDPAAVHALSGVSAVSLFRLSPLSGRSRPGRLLRRIGPAVVLSLAGLVALSVPAFAQNAWPQKPIRLVVPFTPGGVTDAVARLAGEWLSSRLGEAVIVDNRPGANGAIAAEFVMRAAPDGYTLLTASLPQMAILPQMTRTPYDPQRDFAPVVIVGANALALAVNDTVPSRDLRTLLAYARENPGKVSYASAGSGTVSHLTLALLLSRAGVSMAHVPYKGGGPALADVMAGHIPMYFGNLAEVLPHASGGRIRVLAVSSERRASQLPNVPTVAEQGFAGFRTNTWNGIAAPARTPAAIIDRIAREIDQATHDAGFVARLEAIGVEPVGGTAAAFARTLEGDIRLWAEAIRVSGAKVD
jgi:tripartite-type tricarboxylate transporter receptor subunit TctC